MKSYDKLVNQILNESGGVNWTTKDDRIKFLKNNPDFFNWFVHDLKERGFKIHQDLLVGNQSNFARFYQRYQRSPDQSIPQYPVEKLVQKYLQPSTRTKTAPTPRNDIFSDNAYQKYLNNQSFEIPNYNDYLKKLYGDEYENVINSVRRLRANDNNILLRFSADPDNQIQTRQNVYPGTHPRKHRGAMWASTGGGIIGYPRGHEKVDRATFNSLLAHELGHTAQSAQTPRDPRKPPRRIRRGNRTISYPDTSIKDIPHNQRAIEFDRYLGEILYGITLLGRPHPATQPNPGEYTRNLITRISNTPYERLNNEEKRKIASEEYRVLQFKINQILQGQGIENIMYLLPRTFGHRAIDNKENDIA